MTCKHGFMNSETCPIETPYPQGAKCPCKCHLSPEACGHLDGRCLCADAKPMTIKERAYRLGNDLANADHYLAMHRQFDDDDLPILMKHLEQACDEARAEVLEQSEVLVKVRIDAAYEKGFADCRERAAEIVKDHYWDSLEYKQIGKQHGDAIAQRILALKKDQ